MLFGQCSENDDHFKVLRNVLERDISGTSAVSCSKLRIREYASEDNTFSYPNLKSLHEM